MKIECPICKSLYGEENYLRVMEVRDSILGLAKIVTLGCEYCGFIGEVKIHPDYFEEIMNDEECENDWKIKRLFGKKVIKFEESDEYGYIIVLEDRSVWMSWDLEEFLMVEGGDAE